MPESIALEESERTPLQKKTRKRKSRLRSCLILACIGAVLVLSNMAYSSLDPFFPQEAARKKGGGSGSADFEVGLIYGIFAAVIVVAAPPLGAHVTKIGPKFMLCAGVFLIGGATILFAFVDAIASWRSFLVICFFARALQGAGKAAALTASWTIVVTEFPDKVSTVSGIIETFAGLGFMIGPPLGGALYAAGGFTLPFFFVGGLLLACDVALIFTLPTSTEAIRCYGNNNTNNLSSWKLLRNVWIWMTLIATSLVPASFSMIEATLAPFLERTYKMKPAKIGLVYLLCCGVYIISAPFVGRVADTWGTKRVIIGGLFVAGFAEFFLAPSSLLAAFLPDNELWLFLLSSVVIAIGLAMASVPTISDMVLSSRGMGFEKSVALNGVISGLWTCFTSVGNTVGPSIGGLITQKTNFRVSTTVFAFALVTHGCIYLIVSLCFRSRLK